MEVDERISALHQLIKRAEAARERTRRTLEMTEEVREYAAEVRIQALFSSGQIARFIGGRHLRRRRPSQS